MMSPIKWAGGKSKIYPLFKVLYDIAMPTRLIDLFCGSLSIPLNIESKTSVFNDINSALINMFVTIRDNLPELIDELQKLDTEESNSPEFFMKVREEYNKLKMELQLQSQVRYASIFIYLNKRSFNGLYRENKSGAYNVPYRKYDSSIFNEESLRKLSKYLSKNEITFYNQDYSEFLYSMEDFFQPGDLVYLDPPYYPSNESKFTSYSSKPFRVKEQEELFKFCKELDKRGIKFIMSNSPCKEICELYKEFNQFTFTIGRQMRNAEKGQETNEKKLPYPRPEIDNEILIWNFPNLKFD